MTKNQDNKKYRDSIKATLVFDPEILKRYVNFMSNPDEETAIAAGYRPCGICMKEKYRIWKEKQVK